MSDDRQTTWYVIAESELPSRLRFDVPPENTGQIVEVAYGGSSSAKTPWTVLDAPYKCVTDHGTHTSIYYARSASEPRR
jgi:hypothetical protein